jgi:hypothetical protein
MDFACPGFSGAGRGSGFPGDPGRLLAQMTSSCRGHRGVSSLRPKIAFERVHAGPEVRAGWSGRSTTRRRRRELRRGQPDAAGELT